LKMIRRTDPVIPMVDASDAYALSVFPFGLGGGLRYFCTNGWAKQKALR